MGLKVDKLDLKVDSVQDQIELIESKNSKEQADSLQSDVIEIQQELKSSQ